MGFSQAATSIPVEHLVSNESSLRKATAWHCLHLPHLREIVLPGGQEFYCRAKDDSFFENLGPMQKSEDDTVTSLASTSVATEREATPAESGVAKDYWIDRPDAVIRVYKVPGR